MRPVRPGYGLHPKYLPEIIGHRVNKAILKGQRISLEDIIE